MTTTESNTQRYLRRALQMNPMWQSPELVDWRAKALQRGRLDREHIEDSPQAEIAALRNAARGQINRLQAEFWQLPLAELQMRLDTLDTSRLPDLTPVVKRLKTAAAARGTFPQLAQESWMNLDLFGAFKSAVVLPPAEAAAVREKFLSRIPGKQELATMQRAVDQLQEKYPLLYDLERDWFQTIKRFKVRKTREGGGETTDWSDFAELGWPGVILVIVVVRILFYALRFLGD